MDILDKTDLQILRTLQENARLTTKELAARFSLFSTRYLNDSSVLKVGDTLKSI